jgi:hypothetical protein
MAEEKISIFRKESLERLSSPEQLDQLMQVVNAKSWIPLATLGSLVALALVWSVLGRIPMTAVGRGALVRLDASSNQLVSLTFFDALEAGDIQPGMSVMIVPDTADSEQGSLWGRVTSVSGSAITTLEEARQAVNSDLPQMGRVEVLAELERDPSSANGYKWSSPKGASLHLTAGTPTTARITLDEKAPIAFVFPFLEAK